MNSIFDIITLNVLSSAIRLATPVILAALAAAICNKAGVLNLGIDGFITICAFAGIVGAYIFRNYTPLGQAHPIFATYMGVLCAMVIGALLGLLFAFLKDSYNVDLTVLSIAMNMIAVEITVYLMRTIFHQSGTWSDPSIVQLPSIRLPLIDKIPGIGKLLSGYNSIVYFTWILALVLVFVMHKTKYGRYITAVGENLEAARSVGINVSKVRYFALIFSGILSGLAGSFLSIGHLTLFTRDMASGRGWLGNAAALFGFNNPGGSFFAGLFFGFADALALRLQNVTKIPPYIIQVMPYVLTLVILSVVSYQSIQKKRKRAIY